VAAGEGRSAALNSLMAASCSSGRDAGLRRRVLSHERPSGQKGGPPKHFHLEEDEWFYCLAGDTSSGRHGRHELKPGDPSLRGQFLSRSGRGGQYSVPAPMKRRPAARQRYGIVNVGPPSRSKALHATRRLAVRCRCFPASFSTRPRRTRSSAIPRVVDVPRASGP